MCQHALTAFTKRLAYPCEPHLHYKYCDHAQLFVTKLKEDTYNVRHNTAWVPEGANDIHMPGAGILFRNDSMTGYMTWCMHR